MNAYNPLFMSFIKKTDSFGKLVGICAGHGGVYAPAQANLQVAALSAKFTQAKAVLNTVLAARQELADATEARKTAFEDAAVRVMRIRPLVKHLGIPAEVSRKMVRAINRVAKTNSYYQKVSGAAATDAAAGAAAESNSGKTFRTDFMSRLAEFQLLVEMLRECPLYLPPASGLSVAELSACADNLMAVTMAVHEARNRLTAARADRQSVFYDPATGIVPTGKAAKGVLESLLGRSGISGKEIRSVKF